MAGFRGKDIVLVEDEDGFEIPTPINEVVVIDTDDYNIAKVVAPKVNSKAKEPVEEPEVEPADKPVMPISPSPSRLPLRSVVEAMC